VFIVGRGRKRVAREGVERRSSSWAREEFVSIRCEDPVGLQVSRLHGNTVPESLQLVLSILSPEDDAHGSKGETRVKQRRERNEVGVSEALWQLKRRRGIGRWRQLGGRHQLQSLNFS
jgi:hypothetical protein